MKISLLFIFALAAILVVGCTDQSGQPTVPVNNNSGNGSIDYTWYSSQLFFIYYPRGWTVDEPSNGAFVFSSRPASDADNLVQQFIVEIWDGNESTSQEFEAYERALMNEEDIVTSTRNITFKGNPAFEIKYESQGVESNPAFVYKSVFFRNDRWVYRLSSSVEKSKSSTYSPIMETIFDRFVIGSG